MLAFPPPWLPVVSLDAAEVTRVEASYGWESTWARFPPVERGDLLLVATYLLWAGTVPYWDVIRAGGVRGYSLYVHELLELAWYGEHALNPFDIPTQIARYEEAHASALIGEHRFLQALAHYLRGLARRPAPDFSLRELVLANPHGDPPEQDWRDVWERRRDELRLGDDRLDPGKWAEAVEFLRGLGFSRVT
jgi:hypothetical protein